MTWRMREVRVTMATSQPSGHGDQSVQSLATQSTGHILIHGRNSKGTLAKHDCDDSRAGHIPPDASAVIERDLALVRVSQLHCDHGDHDETEQSDGHFGCAWQLSDSASAGHAAPSGPSAAVSTFRCRERVPLSPQETEHADHASHASTEQSTGQTIALHARSASRAGQAFPVPTCGAVTVRARVEAPSSQVREHVPHPPHSPTVQSTGDSVVATDRSAKQKGIKTLLKPGAGRRCSTRCRLKRPQCTSGRAALNMLRSACCVQHAVLIELN